MIKIRESGDFSKIPGSPEFSRIVIIALPHTIKLNRFNSLRCFFNFCICMKFEKEEGCGEGKTLFKGFSPPRLTKEDNYGRSEDAGY